MVLQTRESVISLPSFDLIYRSWRIYEPKWHGNSVSHAERFLKPVTVALRTIVTLCLYAFPMGVRLTQEEATKRMLALGFEPLEAFVSTKTPWKSRHIVCGNVVSPKLGLVSSLGGGCWECRNEKLKTSESEAVSFMLSKNLKPLEPYTSALTRWNSECLICGFICNPKLNDLKSGQGGCVTCGYKYRVSPPKKRGVIRKARYSEAEALVILHGIGRTELETYPGLSMRIWRSRCDKCGTEGSPTLNALVKRGNQCVTCGRIRTSKSKHLSQEEVASRYLKKGLKLLATYNHDSSAPLESQCLKCKRIVDPPLTSIRKSAIGCKYCAGTYVDAEEARDLMMSKGYEPLTKYKSTDAPWKCRHIICGTICGPTYGTIKRGGGGCRNCAVFGYSYDKKSYLYFIKHEEWDAFKVGIANVSNLKKSDRLHKHGTDGWEVVKVWNFDNGTIPMEIEAQFFKTIRKDRGLPVFLKKGVMKYAGETETFAQSAIKESEVLRIVSNLVKKRGQG